MNISIASDHAGFEHKKELIKFLEELKHEVIDFGTYNSKSTDYPDFAFAASEAVSNEEVDFGILICGSGIGMSITANKLTGVRAANCCSNEMAKLARLHNNANVLCLGARLLDTDSCKDIIKVFLKQEFEGGRHNKRVEKIHLLTNR